MSEYIIIKEYGPGPGKESIEERRLRELREAEERERRLREIEELRNKRVLVDILEVDLCVFHSLRMMMQ